MAITLISLENLQRFKGNLDTVLAALKTEIESTYGQADGVAQLDSNGKVVLQQLPDSVFNVASYDPSVAGAVNKIYIDINTNNMYRWDNVAQEYVSLSFTLPDDVYNIVEAVNYEAFPATGAAEKLYIDLSTNHMYRWDGSEYVNMSSPEAVKYVAQDLTAAQKQQARTNIGAAAAGDIPTGAVIYNDAQSLTAAEKAQARTNIGAADSTEVSGLSTLVGDLNDRLNNFGDFVRDVEQTDNGILVTHNEAESTTIPVGLDFNGGKVVEKEEYGKKVNYLYLTKDDNELPASKFEPFVIPAGGGGGGGAFITISNVIKPETVRNGKPADFSFNATSSDDTSLTVRWFVNDELKETQNGQSGKKFSFNAGTYLTPSVDSPVSNEVKVIINSEGGASLTRKYSVTTVAFAIKWGNSIQPIMLNTTNTSILVPIIVSAESGTTNYVKLIIGSKTISKTVVGSATLNVSLDAADFEPGVNLITGSMVSSIDEHDKADDIYFTVIWATGVTTPIVAFADSEKECNQYDTANIDYFVYDPANEIATCTIKAGSDAPKTITASRELQTYQYPALVTFEKGQTVKNIVMTLSCPYIDQEHQEQVVQTTMILKVKKVDYDLSYYRDDSLVYNLDPVGHNNTDADREEFAGLIFSTNFDWDNGGFMDDAQGAHAFVIKKGNHVTLPRCLFQDSDVNGKTIDISFKVTNSDQYGAVAMQELNNGDIEHPSTKGIILRANNGELRLNNSVGREFRYCEESRVDLSVHVESNVDQRVMTIWLDGIPSNVGKYETAGTLVQNENELVIGSEHCDVWIYGIRVYNAALSKQQMIQNYVSCGNTTTEKANRYTINTILDNRDRISFAALHSAMPNLTLVQIEAERMTTSKSDKVPANITITDGSTVLELLSTDGTVFMVQGTSSAAYGRSAYNLDMDFKNSGKKYKISENAIAVNYLNIKVNVASSENANNINAVDWYNTYQPYLTESRSRPGVRDTVEGKPCAVFITNTSNEAKWFSSLYLQPNETVLYAMGDLCNSKKNKAIFGQDGKIDEYVTHPTKACIEVSGNDTEPERFRSTAAQFNPEADDGKGRWETEEWDEQEQKYKTIKHFEWRMNPSSDDLQSVVTAWDNTVAWLVSTIGDSAKFKNEIGNYFAVDSLLYHFLFIEYFAGYDNVSKNTFYSYDWDASEQKYLWNIKAAYDMDTILAADNDGVPFGDYGIDYGDTVDGTPIGRQYFNAVTNTIWVNLKEAFQSELSAMYIALRSRGAWNSQNIISKWDNYQTKRPHASMIIDAYNKYIEPYKTTGVIIGTETKGYDDSYLPRLNGSKTYWRKQFLTYQTSYMDGKYGYYDTTNTMNFRTNGTEGTKSFTVKSYAKTYMTMIKDSNKVASMKVNAGSTVTFNNVMVGNNTTMYVTPDRLVQYVRPLNETQNSTFAAAGASKLIEVILGSESQNTDWPAGSGINVPSVMLEDFSIRNLTNFSESLSFAQNVALKTLDTRGTRAGIITLPSFAPLTSIQLNACTGIAAYNLNKVETFTMENGTNLVSVIVENCNKKYADFKRIEYSTRNDFPEQGSADIVYVATDTDKEYVWENSEYRELTNIDVYAPSVMVSELATYLQQATEGQQSITRRIRAIGINWSFTNLDVLSKIASTWKGYNNLKEQQDKPVVTGYVHVTTLSKKKLEIINSVWGAGSVDDHLDTTNKRWSYGDLTITYNSLIPYFTVTFNNMDDTHIKDKSGNDYYQYIDLNDQAYDPIAAGEINTPTYTDPSGQYRYTFTDWDNLSGNVTENKTVTAQYIREVITYTVRWYDKQGGTIYDERTDVPYGSEVVYDPEGTIGFPTLTDEEAANVFKVFTGWDKSTGYITGNTNVYATWDVAPLPTIGSKLLQNMSVAEIYGITKKNLATSYFSDERRDYVDISLGKDFDFNPPVGSSEPGYVRSEVLLENRYFDGTEILRMQDKKLFTADTSFTLVVDYEFCDNDGNASLVSCGSASDAGINDGFSLYHSNNNNINIVCSSTARVIDRGYNRTVVVIRHKKGSRSILITSANNGRSMTLNNGTEATARSYYAGYNEAVLSTEDGRTYDFGEDAYLCFGAEPTGTIGAEHYAKGWIHWCKIWYDDLGRENAKELACWPHETLRMCYRGSNIYSKGDGTGLKANASFIASAPLSQYYEFYQNTNEGAWEQSLMRSFVNDRCFKALPYSWQGIIQTVNVITKSGAGALTPKQTTKDKIYLPSQADLMTVSSEYIAPEGTPISWFSNNEDRVKFTGIISTTDSTRVIKSNTDPTMQTETYTPQAGDIWYNTRLSPNIGYVYVPASVANKHYFYGGRVLSDTGNNIMAQGPSGGVWVRAIGWHLRTNAYDVTGQSSSTDVWSYIVAPSGNPTNYIYDQAGQNMAAIVLMFSV